MKWRQETRYFFMVSTANGVTIPKSRDGNVTSNDA